MCSVGASFGLDGGVDIILAVLLLLTRCRFGGNAGGFSSIGDELADSIIVCLRRGDKLRKTKKNVFLKRKFHVRWTHFLTATNFAVLKLNSEKLSRVSCALQI